MFLDVVSSLGMVTNLGRDVRTSCAAARAGISRFSSVGEFTTFDPDTLETPVIGAPIAGFTDGFAATGTFVRLAHTALADLIRYGGLPGSDNHEFWSHTSVVWCLPEVTFDRFMWPQDEVTEILQVACAERLLDVAGLPLAVSPAGQLPKGHIGAADALSRIDALASDTGAERLVLLATDSYMDELAMRVLMSEDRLKSPETPAGLMPGEAGAAILLEAEGTATSVCGPQCRIEAAAAIDRPESLDDEDVSASRRAMAPDVARKLSAVVEAVLNQAQCQSFAGTIFLDLNGEEWKAVAWGLALMHLERRLSPEHSTIEYPCISFGEIGAASAVTALCLASRAFVRGYSRGDRALVLSIGDRGQVSAILVHAGS
jgi:3-oxoacyl-[acyl-carrier-protein] synthase-1